MPPRENARRFHFLREIASGGFGTVWLCKVVHPDGFSRLAAVKLLKAQWTDSEEVVRRMRDEARLLGLLRHRSIITVSDLTSIDGRAAVVMEYVEGIDLRNIVQACREHHQEVPARAALEIATAVASALDAAYNRPPMPGDKPLRVIHRDIKPGNVMIDAQGTVKVLDFGVARSDIEGRESHTEELQFGSVDYMAPERLFFEPETPAGDVYALGATLFELLALEKLGKARGRPEQHAAQVEDRLSFLRARLRVRPTAATELVDTLRAAVAFEHERRPTAAELHQRLRALARLVEDEELQPWAERFVPPLVERAGMAPRAPNPMLDTVRLEDSISRGFTGEVGPGLAGLGEQVRRGALRELDDSTGRERPTASPAPVEVEEEPADDWTERPTTVGVPGDPLNPPEPLSSELLSIAGASRALPADPGQVELPPARPVPSAGLTIAPATGAPATGAPLPARRPAEEIHPGYEVEPTVVDPEETTSNRADVLEPVPDLPADAPPVGAARRPAGRLTAIVLGGLAGGCLLVLLSGGLLAGGALWWARSGGALPALVGPDDEVVAEVGAEPPAASAELAALVEDAPATGGIHFTSLAAGTRKLNVDCTGASGRGVDSVDLAATAAERCTVTAILQDRSRLVAVVQGAQAGAYDCFEGGEAKCTPR